MSLKKSERGLVDVEAIARRAAADHVLPVKKHSSGELDELRRITAAPPEKSISYVNSLAAPWWQSLLMYVLVMAALLAGWTSKAFNSLPSMDFPADWIANLYTAPSTPQNGKLLMIVLCGVALAMAGWIALKRPRTRHHAGFVLILAILVLSFGIIYHQ